MAAAKLISLTRHLIALAPMNCTKCHSNSAALRGLSHGIMRPVLVHAALAAWSRAHITAARAALAASEVATIAVLAASTTRPNADISTARGPRAATELCSVAVCALVAIGNLIRAESGCSHGILVADAV